MKKFAVLIALLFVFSVSASAQLEHPAATLIRLLINLGNGAAAGGPAQCVPGRIYNIRGQRYRCEEREAAEDYRNDPYDDRNYSQSTGTTPLISNRIGGWATACRQFQATGTIVEVFYEDGFPSGFVLRRKRLGRLRMIVDNRQAAQQWNLRTGTRWRVAGRQCAGVWNVRRALPILPGRHTAPR